MVESKQRTRKLENSLYTHSTGRGEITLEERDRGKMKRGEEAKEEGRSSGSG